MADLSQLSDEQLHVYRDLVAQKQGGTPQPQAPKVLSLEGAKVSAPSEQGPFAKAEKYLGDTANDIRTGGTSTIVGRGLHALGAKGTSVGNSPAVGDFMASPIQGPLRMAQGASQLPQEGKRMQGAKNIVGGAMDTAQMPAAFMGGPVAAAEKLDAVIPSAARAGENFQKVAQGVGKTPVNVSDAAPIAQRALQLDETGANAPKVVKQFAEASHGTGGAMPYDMSRDFASNAGRLSASDSMAANPAMARQVAMLSKALDTANEGAAESAGLGKEYRSAMTEYRRAQQMKSVGKNALKYAIPAAVGGGIMEHYAKKALGVGN